ncbi:MAG: UTP--glucose-1-phosphate uridylyltransferase [Clostridia bacterium]|nr:UTP--glucose-1-phosphate uridylyltransferase [Clostridia bacterium]
MVKKVKKAVIPVAGFGTRFMPYTKAVPKAMLPIVNIPAIQIIADEVVKSGITDILFIVGYRAEVIKNHFSASPELDVALLKANKTDFYNAVKYPETMANISYVTQEELNGTAGALKYAKDFVGNDPFAILFGDDVMYNADYPVTKQLIDVYEKTGKAVIGCANVLREEVPKYASVEYSSVENGGIYNVTKIVEKPKLEDVKSTLSPLGRYVVESNVFDIIEGLTPAPNGEYYFTDVLDYLASQNKAVAYVYDAIHYDMGSRLGYLKANIEYGLRDKELGAELKEYIKELVK